MGGGDAMNQTRNVKVVVDLGCELVSSVLGKCSLICLGTSKIANPGVSQNMGQEDLGT